MSQSQTPSFNSGQRMSRRRFMAGAGAAALSFTVIKPGLAVGSGANSKVRAGFIGCGERGTWITELFVKHGGYEIAAAADYFQDRVDAFADKFNVPANSRFTTLSGYKKLLEQQLDAVVIESPPYFHPEQAAAAIEAGRHVYVAKPIAVDVPGCDTMAKSGVKATEKKLCFRVDFQTRAMEFYREAIKRTHNGDIGKIVCGEAAYQCYAYWKKNDLDMSTPEGVLRNWPYDKLLSGDSIVEQHIHAIDVVNWALQGKPVKAYGTGAKTCDISGSCRDHWAVIFEYPADVSVSFNSTQFKHHYNDVMCRIFGSDGHLETHYGGEVMVRGNRPYKGGKTSEIYTEGAATNIAEFYEDITKGNCANETVKASVQSNLASILARSAAYGKGELTWDAMLKSNEKIEADLSGLKA